MTESPPPVAYVEGSPDDGVHLRTLSVCWYVASGLSALCGCGTGVLLIGVSQAIPKAMENVPVQPGQSGPPKEFVELFGWMYGGMGVLYLLLGLGSAVLEFLTARFLMARRHRTFCFVAAAIACLSVPIGTILGIFTIVVLMRPSVVVAFHRNEQARA